MNGGSALQPLHGIWETRSLTQAALFPLRSALLCFTDVYLQIEDKTPPPGKDYDWLYCSGLEPNPHL